MAIRNITFEDKSFSISYFISDNSSSKWILFLHGWGAKKELMYTAFKGKFIEFNHIYIDLPGFGGSSNDYVLSTIDYANIVSYFLKILKIKPLYIFGHSFGGKVAILLNPEVLVLLSSAGILRKKKIKVRLKIFIAKLFKYSGIKSKIFRTKDADNLRENMYETLKIVVNEDFSGIFSNFNNLAYIFWGTKDNITPLSSGEIIHSLIKNSHFYPLEGDHFFFLNNSENIHRIINGTK